VLFASAIGQTICRSGAPLGLARVEGLWLDQAMIRTGFVEAVIDWMPRLKPKEWFRPAQVDPHGNSTTSPSAGHTTALGSGCLARAGFPMSPAS